MAYTQSFDVEFDDSLLSYKGFTNPRYGGSKLVAKEINKYVNPNLNPGIGSGLYPTDAQVSNSDFVASSSLDPNFEFGWGGDITYGKNPVIENKISAIFIGSSITDGTEDTTVATISGHSYVTIDKILLINTETDDVQIMTPENTNPEAFRRFIINNLHEGDSISFKLFATQEGLVVGHKLKKDHIVKFNEGTLMKVYTYTPDRTTGFEDGVVGGYGLKYHADAGGINNSLVAGFTDNLAKAGGPSPTADRPGGGLFSFGQSVAASQSLFTTNSIDFINELPDELNEYENDINLNIAGEVLTVISSSYSVGGGFGG